MTVGRVRPVGDAAVLVEVEGVDPDDVWRRVRALDRAFVDAEGVVEVCPGLVNLLVHFDPLVTDHAEIAETLRSVDLSRAPSVTPRDHVVDVTYGGSAGPDLGAVARAAGLDVDDVVRRHVAASYRVMMYGFAPGYAYLGGVPTELQLPRKETAVRDVPAGSVIIANDQCLVTTLTMPTGWWVIGRSSTPILTPHDNRPARFDVGDRVRFRAVMP